MKIFWYIAAPIIFVLPFFAFAHGSDEVGRVEVGERVIIVDSIVETLFSGRAERLNVEIEKKDATSTEAKRVDYAEVWIRITGPNDEFLFSGNLHRATVGFVTGFTFFFADSGDYELTTRFLNKGDIVGEGTIVIPVSAAAGQNPNLVSQLHTHSNLYFLTALFSLGLVLGALLLWGICWQRKANK